MHTKIKMAAVRAKKHQVTPRNANEEVREVE